MGFSSEVTRQGLHAQAGLLERLVRALDAAKKVNVQVWRAGKQCSS